jgi:2-polyprenyl-3-methyl-5-hydroxy-6-metoxy-1,4-benzoquinol methylase
METLNKEQKEEVVEHFKNTFLDEGDAKEVVKETISKSKEYDSAIYNIRYKYGYNWSCYQNLSAKLVRMMIDNGEKDKKTIDIGCGVGWFTDMYYFNVSRDVKGIDFSELGIRFHAERMYPAIEFEIANIYDYDYTGNEVAIMMEVLEHVDNDKELISKLPEGCMLYATVPFEKDRQDITHVREYSIDETMKRYGDLLEFKACEKFENYIIIVGKRK